MGIRRCAGLTSWQRLPMRVDHITGRRCASGVDMLAACAVCVWSFPHIYWSQRAESLRPKEVQAANIQKSEVMCFNFRPGSFLPPLSLMAHSSPTQTPSNISVQCDRQINLLIAADAALRPFMAGTFRIKQFVKSHDLASQVANKLHAHIYLAPQNLHKSC